MEMEIRAQLRLIIQPLQIKDVTYVSSRRIKKKMIPLCVMKPPASVLKRAAGDAVKAGGIPIDWNRLNAKRRTKNRRIVSHVLVSATV
ncbi:hypothetical protein EYF80_032166 [Liparis tanakae]|uniref:Uncharacterized protein n=1 Tax=Liparis tanakae TaxID=230148 RepID=A0A4Z2GVT3_9TELE|nr:hypothetical protein EYF80_032166 [Liparis tanakae]